MVEVFVSISAPTQSEAVQEINLALAHQGYDERISESDYITESGSDETDAAFAGDKFYTFAISIDDGIESICEAFRGTDISIEPVQ